MSHRHLLIFSHERAIFQSAATVSAYSFSEIGKQTEIMTIPATISRKLLVFPAIDSARLQTIQNISRHLNVVNATDKAEALLEISDADAFYGKMTPELLSRANALQWIQTPTASLEHYLFPELIAHPAQLTNMRGLFSDVIADHVLGFVITFARNLHLYRDAQSRNHWGPIGDEHAQTDFLGGPGNVTPVDLAHKHLSDCTMGIVGVGEIGREIAKRAHAFGMKLFGVDPKPTPIPDILEEIWPLDRLPELLQQSDFVVIAAPHTPSSEKLFDADMISQMSPESYLINIGRGAIVDLAALTDALLKKQIAGAALDVFEIEPLPSGHPLWAMPNVLITPHIAAASLRVPERHLQMLLENIRRFLNDEPLLNSVDKQAWC
ncbi:putative 2-hydroxyacid dehydrogenase [Rubinisphaera italica]|uniref:Putative 2-hydroxyacid dehydrogenase n=2 Tax=Rubinisphaera italica TaxID=2527969 RepID=A0A5C5XBB0_9PLAN|nr:putative 2-hydroxyacid dehydrogenase [Rubinisphaera italica]